MPNITIKSNPSVQDNFGMQNMPPRQEKNRGPWFRVVLLVILIAVLAALAILFKDKLIKKEDTKLNYQAVFLTNGQVYFGKLNNPNSEYVTLTDIYYLQQLNQQQLQTGVQAQQQEPKLQLVKLGNELHGPVDMMRINRSQVLFYEDLKQDSKVIQAIISYRQTGGNPPAQQQQDTQQKQQEAPSTKQPGQTQTPSGR